MHDFLINAVFALSNSLRASALELDRTGDGAIDCNTDHVLFLQLLQRELPDVRLSQKEVCALATTFEGSEPGSIDIDNFIYAIEQSALQSLNVQKPSRAQKDYERIVEVHYKAEEGRGEQPTRVVTAPRNTPTAHLLSAIQRKIRSRTSGVTTENRLFLDMDTSRTGTVSLREMLIWFHHHGLDMTEAQLTSLLHLVAERTRDRGRYAFTWSGTSDAQIGYHGFDNLIAGLVLPTGSAGKRIAPTAWLR